MNIKPFVVWHSDAVLMKEAKLMAEDDKFAEEWQGSSTRRYLVWAESRIEAARAVQAHKKENNRLLVDEYEVCSLIQGEHMKVIGLSDDDEGDSNEWDLNQYENLFGSPIKVRL